MPLTEGQNLTVFGVEDGYVLLIDDDGNKYQLVGLNVPATRSESVDPEPGPRSESVECEYEIWLQEDEQSGRAGCGCEIGSHPEHGNPYLKFCPMHSAAAALKQACEAVVSTSKGESGDLAEAVRYCTSALALTEGVHPALNTDE